MSNYIGVRCPVCNKKFVQADDIVVCPVCGAPHHRGCYAQKNACAFVSEHINGKEWRPPAPDPQSATARSSGGGDKPDVITCPRCDSANPKGTVFCRICGKRLSETPPQTQGFPGMEVWGFPGFGGASPDQSSMMYGGASPDDVIDGESARDLAVYIGENSAYYLPRFKSMDETSRTFSFNFSALVFSFFYFFYRKMYIIGIILTAFFAIGMIPSILMAHETMPLFFANLQSKGMLPPPLAEINYSQMPVNYALITHYQSLVNMASSINFLITLIASFCANRLYQMKATADIKKLRENRTEPHSEGPYSDSLASRGGSSKTAVIISAFVMMLAYFMVCTTMAYQFVGGLGL